MHFTSTQTTVTRRNTLYTQGRRQIFIGGEASWGQYKFINQNFSLEF